MLQVVTEILIHAGTNLRPSWDSQKCQPNVTKRHQGRLAVWSKGPALRRCVPRRWRSTDRFERWRVSPFHRSHLAVSGSRSPTMATAIQNQGFRCISMFPKVAKTVGNWINQQLYCELHSKFLFYEVNKKIIENLHRSPSSPALW